MASLSPKTLRFVVLTSAILCTLLLLVAGVELMRLSFGDDKTNPRKAGGFQCTMEAKVCPDGSAVGRTGPRCEFAPCPGEGGAVTDFDSCVAAGNPVMESYPRQCAAGGQTYVEVIP